MCLFPSIHTRTQITVRLDAVTKISDKTAQACYSLANPGQNFDMCKSETYSVMPVVGRVEADTRKYVYTHTCMRQQQAITASIGQAGWEQESPWSAHLRGDICHRCRGAVGFVVRHSGYQLSEDDRDVMLLYHNTNSHDVMLL